AGPRYSLNRSNVAQESSLAFVSNPRNRSQLRSKVAQLPPLAMISNCEPMRLIANHLQQTQYQRMRVEIDWLILAAFHYQICNFIVTLWRLNNTNHRDRFQS